jgi:CheY-like chemotaxis protein
LQRNLLIVEDDDMFYESMEAVIESELTKRDIHAEVRRARTFMEAKELLKRFVPHVISIDMEFPKRDIGGKKEYAMGAELASYVLARYKIPVIIYSGNAKEEIVRRLESHGVGHLEAVFQKRVGGAGPWAEALMKHLA